MRMFVLGVILAALPVSARADEPMIGHMVFFKLKDASAEAKQKLVAACDKYLSKQDGEVYYSAGVRAEDFKREVNDTDFDVALHVVFKDKAAHDKYAVDPQHLNSTCADCLSVRRRVRAS